MQNTKLEKNLERLYSSGSMLAIILSIVGLLYAVNLFKEGKLIGSNAQNTISISGMGKVTAKPDTSNITFTVRQQAKDNKEGQDKIAKKIALALPQIKKLVDEKDIKTNSYSSYPRYLYPANSQAKIDGYDVSQSVTIKVRKIDDVAKVLDIISTSGINEVSGPDYVIDNDDIYKDQARALAIKQAKEKAEVLAGQLGVNITRIVSFAESGSGPRPMYMMKAMSVSQGSDVATAPELPTGENEISSSVTITFEIK